MISIKYHIIIKTPLLSPNPISSIQSSSQKNTHTHTRTYDMFFSVIFGFLCVPAFRLSQVRIMEWTSYKGDRVNCSSEKVNVYHRSLFWFEKCVFSWRFCVCRSSASTSPFWSFNFFFNSSDRPSKSQLLNTHMDRLCLWHLGQCITHHLDPVISFDSWHPMLVHTKWLLYMEFLWMGPLLNGPFLNR